MVDLNSKKILRTFFNGEIGCIEYDNDWLPQLEEFCSVAKDLGYINNASPEAMKIDEIQYHCMIHIPTKKIYAVAGVQYMPEYKEGYYRIWTRLCRIPNQDIPMTTTRRYGRGEMPEFDGLLYFNCEWATQQPNYKATFGTTLANKAYSDNYVKTANTITDYVAKNWWKRKGIAEPEGITEFYAVPQVVWRMHFDKFKDLAK